MIKKNNYLYNNGYPFIDPLPKNLLDQKRRVLEENHVCAIIIDGVSGQGKTTIAIEVLEAIQGEKINYDEQMAVGGEQFSLKLSICEQKKKYVIIYDEAGDFNRRGFITRFNAAINRAFETYRTFKIIVIITLPLVSTLDPELINKSIPQMLIHCYGRTKNYGRYKVYDIQRMSYLIDKLRTYKHKPPAYTKTRPNFRGIFKNLPPKREEELNKFTTKEKREINKTTSLKLNKLLSQQEIADKLLKSKIWVRKSIKELKIKPQKILNKKYYYKNDIIKTLEGAEK